MSNFRLLVHSLLVNFGVVLVVLLVLVVTGVKQSQLQLEVGLEFDKR